jgi:hypothetical protein
MKRTGLLAILVVLAGCSTSGLEPGDVHECQYILSRTGFLQELLFARGTPRTPAFDDYTPGSYHVEKMDLLEGVRELRSQEEAIVGVAVYGPFGPIWAYNVVLFMEEEEGKLRANWVHFPHARITQKATRELTNTEYRQLLLDLAASSVIAEGNPTFETLRDTARPDLGLESSFAFLIADWSQGSERVWHSVGDWMTLSAEELEEISSPFAAIFETSTTTYSTSLPDGYDTEMCPEEPW